MTEDETLARARTALTGVYDPELGIDVVDLGLVYDLRVEDGRVVVDMTLTTPGCPVSETLPAQARDAIAAAVGPDGYGAEVNIVWDPPWTPDRISEEAAERLGLRRG